MRARTACVLTDRDGVRATDRDDERHGAGPDGERRVGTAFDMRCGYDRRVRTVRFGTMCERDGAGAAGVAGRVHGFGATGGDTDLFCRLVVYELVYGIEATDVAVVEVQLHYAYA